MPTILYVVLYILYLFIYRSSGYNFTGTIRQDRIKGGPPLLSVEKFKKKDKPRGYYETVVLEDESQILTRWKDNAPVSLLSSCLGDLPLGTARRFSRTEHKYIGVQQPHVVRSYNPHMGGVDRFDQNINHCRTSIGGKKWYWQIVTWLLDTAAQNAWQLHCKAGGTLTCVQFRRELVMVLLKENIGNRVRHSSGFSTAGQKSSIGRISRPGDEEVRYDGLGHYVVKTKERKVCNMDGCSSKVNTVCEKCNRAVCVEHFKDYHVK